MRRKVHSDEIKFEISRKIFVFRLKCGEGKRKKFQDNLPEGIEVKNFLF